MNREHSGEGSKVVLTLLNRIISNLFRVQSILTTRNFIGPWCLINLDVLGSYMLFYWLFHFKTVTVVVHIIYNRQSHF